MRSVSSIFKHCDCSFNWNWNFFWKFGHPNRFLPLELIIGGDKTGCLLLLQSELSQAFIIIIQSLYVVASGVWPCCHTQPTCCLPKRFLSTGYPLSTSTYSSSVISPNVALTAAEQYSTEIGDFLTNFTTLTRQNHISYCLKTTQNCRILTRFLFYPKRILKVYRQGNVSKESSMMKSDDLYSIVIFRETNAS